MTQQNTPRYSATFTFAKKQFDDTFYRLDEQIAQVAKSIPGYLGEASWENPAKGLYSNVYYWDSLEALQLLMQHPTHLEAKAKQAQWLDGYHVEIAQVLRSYGDELDGLMKAKDFEEQFDNDFDIAGCLVATKANRVQQTPTTKPV